jgi:TolA-binding protein
MGSGPLSSPSSSTGRLQHDVDDLERQVRQKADSHEIHRLEQRVGTLENTVRTLESVASELRNTLYDVTERLENIAQELQERKEN